MTLEEAWKSITDQIKHSGRKTIFLVIGIILIAVGAFTIIANAYVGIGIIVVGSALMIIMTRVIKNTPDTVGENYEKYVLTAWLNEEFDEVVFGSKYAFTKKEIKELRFFEDNWNDYACNRSFSASINGQRVRGAEIILSQDNVSKGSNWRYEEPLFVFWGRAFEFDTAAFAGVEESVLKSVFAEGSIKIYNADNGKTYLFHNLYSDLGAYPWWMPQPTKDTLNYEKLHESVLDSVKIYKAFLKQYLGEHNEQR